MRAVFIQLTGSRKGQRDVYEDALITVGRDPGNLMQYHPLEDVRCSARHAEIRLADGGYTIHDAGSRNGTFVDGKRIQEADLTHGCEIQFGFGGPKVRFEIENEPVPAMSAPAVEAVDDEQEAEAEEQAPAASAQPAGAASAFVSSVVVGAARRGVAFEHLNGVRQGRTQRIAAEVVRIGRNPESELHFDPEGELSVSWMHARIIDDAGAWVLEDLESRNGTFVNGERVERATLHADDRLRLGRKGPEMRVRFFGPDKTPERTMLLPEVGAISGVAGPAVLEPLTLGPAGCLLGRDPRCDLVLDHPAVSRRHAAIKLVEGAFHIEDLNSLNGTFVNGVRLAERQTLHEGDKIYIPNYVIEFRAGELRGQAQEGNVRVEGVGLGRGERSRGRRGTVRVLDDVSLAIEPREFVGILGRTGSGKSSLIDVLSGRRRPDAGAVFYNNDVLGEHYEHYRTAIGYVPQEDIVHGELTVARALWHAARLRLPGDTSAEELRGRVEEVLHETDLGEHRGAEIRHLSGGEMRRLNLGVELICKPNVLFLDEATAGLDAGSDYEIMGVFRRLANEGKTIVCITHNVEHVSMCDLVALLHEGRLVYYGPPAQMLAHFQIERVSEVYGRLADKPARQWQEEYEKTAAYATYVRQRLRHADRQAEEAPARPRTGPPRGAGAAGMVGRWLRQFAVLSQRQAEILRRDLRGLLWMIVQAPLLALLIALVFRAEGDAAATAASVHLKSLFVAVLAAVWFGCTNGVREIAKEERIYLRERAVGLLIPPYIFSKLVPLGLICALQCGTLLLVLRLMTDLGGSFAAQFAVLLLTAVAALLMGLLASALGAGGGLAYYLVPAMLMPQVVLADAIVRLRGAALALGRLTAVAYWGYDGLKTTVADVAVGAAGTPLRDVAVPSPGGGGVTSILGRLGSLPADMAVLGVFCAMLLLVLAAVLRLKDTEL